MRVGVFLGLSLGLLAMGTARADGPPVLGLEELIQTALKRSTEVQLAQDEISAAQGDLSQAKAAQWPQLDVVLVGGPVNDAEEPIVISRERPPGSGRFVGRIESPTRDDEITGIGPFGRLEFNLIQPLYTFGKIGYRKEAAIRGVKVKQAEMEQTKGELVRRVKELYYSLILAQQGRETAEETDDFIQDARKRIKRLLDLGSTNVNESDLYRVEAYAAEAKRFKAKAEAGLRLAYMALKQTVGLPREYEFQLDRTELPTGLSPLDEEEKYINKALALRPELEQIERGLEARRYLVEAAKADLYPTIFAAAMGTLSRAPGRDDLDDPYISDGFNQNSAGVVLGAKWHFDFGIGHGKVARAQAEYRRLVHRKESAERKIAVEVTKHYQAALEHQIGFKASEKAASAARKWIVAAFANFDMGIGPARDIFDAVERYSKNRGEFLLSLYRYNLALANLSYAVGEHRSRALR